MPLLANLLDLQKQLLHVLVSDCVPLTQQSNQICLHVSNNY